MSSAVPRPLVRFAQLRAQIDLVHHALGEIAQDAHLVVRPWMRLAVDDAERAERVSANRQRDAGVGDDFQIANRRVVAIQGILPRVGNHQRFLQGHRMLAERVTERRLAP